MNNDLLYWISSITIACIGVYVLQSKQNAMLFSVIWSILRHWSQLIKNMFSLSLSTSEQSIFEEEFKYLIVTSSVFNQTPQPTTCLLFDTPANIKKKNVKIETSFTMRLILVSSLNVIFSLVILTKYNSVSPVLFTCLIPAYFATCYFLYKHHRHVQVRIIHASALESMHTMISLSQESDGMMNQLLMNNGQIEQQQQTLGTLLSNHFESYIEFVLQLQPLIDTRNLSTLREMYNVNQEIPSTLLEFDSHQYKMDDINLIYNVIGWKRREYLLYLLALDVMSTNQSKVHYGKNWRQAIQVNSRLVQEYIQFNKELLVMVEDTKVKSDTALVSQKESSSDARSITLMHRVSALEKHVQDIQAKLFLCKQETKTLSSGRVSVLGLDRMSKRFSDIDQHFIQLLQQWEESKTTLNTFIEDEQSKLTEITLLPSPPSSPRGQLSFYPEQEQQQEEQHVMMSKKSQSFHGFSSNHFLHHQDSLPSFTKNRLKRIQSLKTRIVVEKPTLAPIQT